MTAKVGVEAGAEPMFSVLELEGTDADGGAIGPLVGARCRACGWVGLIPVALRHMAAHECAVADARPSPGADAYEPPIIRRIFPPEADRG